MGSVDVSISGEEAATEGWPVGEVGFVDGWSLNFSTLVVGLEGFELRGADGERASIEVEPVADRSPPGGFASSIASRGSRRGAGRTSATASRRPPRPPWTRGRWIRGSVSGWIDNGWSIYLEATAEKEGLSRSLAWGFDLNVLARACEAADGSDGLVIPAGGLEEAEITLHFDHLFFDDLRLDRAEMRFEAMSAVADAEGQVSLEALDAQRLVDLRDAEGAPLLDESGAVLVYDSGLHPPPGAHAASYGARRRGDDRPLERRGPLRLRRGVIGLGPGLGSGLGPGYRVGPLCPALFQLRRRPPRPRAHGAGAARAWSPSGSTGTAPR